MKRLLITLLMTVTAGIMLAGCGGPDLTGSWYESAYGTSELVMAEDGTFYEDGKEGKYKIEDDSIILDYDDYMDQIYHIEEIDGTEVMTNDERVFYREKEKAEEVYSARFEDNRKAVIDAFAGEWEYSRDDEYETEKVNVTLNEDGTLEMTYSFREKDGYSPKKGEGTVKGTWEACQSFEDSMPDELRIDFDEFDDQENVYWTETKIVDIGDCYSGDVIDVEKLRKSIGNGEVKLFGQMEKLDSGNGSEK